MLRQALDFPEWLLAIARPHWEISLLDSLQKRTKFLDHVADAAGIKKRENNLEQS